MKTIIDEIYNKMFVYFGESIEMFSCGDITQQSASNYHKELVHNLIVQKLDVQKEIFNPNDEVYDNLMKLSLTTNFVSFINATIFVGDIKYTCIGMFLTSNINEKQRKIATYCLEQFKKDNVNVEVGLFDEGKLNILMPDEFIKSINSSEQNTKVLKKVNQ